MALSSAEAKYMAASTALCEAIWLRKLLVNLFRRKMEATRIMCDNRGCIKLSGNPVFHDHSKHIEIRYRHLRDCAHKEIVKLLYILTEEKTTYILTKALARSNFICFKGKLGVVHNPFLTKRDC